MSSNRKVKSCLSTVEYIIVLCGSFKDFLFFTVCLIFIFPFHFDFLFVVELDIMDDMFGLN